MAATTTVTEPCAQCGMPVVRIDGRFYLPHINGALHGCTAPDHEIPEPDGQPMFLNDDGDLVTEDPLA